jgi:hypothetical protein
LAARFVSSKYKIGSLLPSLKSRRTWYGFGAAARSVAEYEPDDLLRMRHEHRIGSIDLQTGTFSGYCSTACPENRSIRFDSSREPWKRYVKDLQDLRALSVSSGFELIVIVWEGGGWRNLPQKGFIWTDHVNHECVVSDLADEKWQTCIVACHPIGQKSSNLQGNTLAS